MCLTAELHAANLCCTRDMLGACTLNIFEWDGLFIMLAEHKCLKIFPVLKSVYFPPTSPPILQLPLSQHMITEALLWKRMLSHDTGPETEPNCCVAQPHIFMRRGGCILFDCPVQIKQQMRQISGLVFFFADLPGSGGRQQVGARALTECFQPTESIWAEMCLQTRYWVKLVVARVWTA